MGRSPRSQPYDASPSRVDGQGGDPCLEADAHSKLGEAAQADSLYRAVLTPRSFADGDLEAMVVLQAIALRSLEARALTRK